MNEIIATQMINEGFVMLGSGIVLLILALYITQNKAKWSSLKTNNAEGGTICETDYVLYSFLGGLCLFCGWLLTVFGALNMANPIYYAMRDVLWEGSKALTIPTRVG